MSDPAFWFRNVSKTYRLYPTPKDRLWEALSGRTRHVEVRALRDVSATVARGGVVGVIGENGSGKSTLLKILAGTTEATTGEVHIPGRVASILELGAAFHPEFTGRRNVVLQAALAGLTREETQSALPEIEAFAELGEFFDRPVKTYSSGMQMRLAFAVATAVLPDVILLDEALAVGDARFQKKCVDRIFDLKAAGKTIFFCSHAMYYVTTLCDQGIWLRQGEVASQGDAHAVVQEYERFLSRQDKSSTAPVSSEIRPDSHGRLTGVRLYSGDEPRESFRPGEAWTAELELSVDAADRPVQIHLAVSTRDNVVCFSADSRADGFGPFVGSQRYRVRVSLEALPLAKGEFIVHAYLGDEKALALFDARSDVAFHVEAPAWRSGLLDVRPTWELL